MGGLALHHLIGPEHWARCALDGLGVDPRGLVRLKGDAAVTAGTLVSFTLDSERPGCAWHRVFVDAIVPPGCSLSVEAASADGPLEDGGLDIEAWVDCGALDRRPARVDVPFAQPVSPPSGDRTLRVTDRLAGQRYETFEGLVRAPPGRYLRLKITLRGTRRRAPALVGARVSSPRPSLLSYLPAFWRTTPRAAALEELLALFEGPLVELETRLGALPALLDPRRAPAEALDWLGGLLDLALDSRLPEPRRRQLLLEAASLYRRRGTTPGLARICSLVLDADVRIIEHFRLRSAGALLGPGEAASELAGSELSAPAVLGPALQLDGEAELSVDPRVGLYGRLAHRFTVVVPIRRDADAEALLEAAIEAHKPAHTLHEILWLDHGLRLGRGSLLDLTTVLQEAAP